MSNTNEPPHEIRLDKWLWAARLYKTRTQAQKAIEGGKVHYNNARVKVHQRVTIGATLKIRQGPYEKHLEILKLSGTRRDAKTAQTLYEETKASIQQRESLREQHRLANAMLPKTTGKPNKKQRRQIRRYARGQKTED